MEIILYKRLLSCLADYRRCIHVFFVWPLFLLSSEIAAREFTDDSVQRQFDCIVQPSQVVDIGSGIPGIVAALSVDRNHHVDKNQIIATLESDVERAAIDRLRARVNMTSGIEVREINAGFSETLKNSSQSLQARDMISVNEYERLKTEAQIARVQLSEAKDERTIAYLELLQAEAALEQKTIRSPISGIVVERFKSGGEYVDDKPLVRLANIDVLYVEILAPVELFGLIESGMSVSVSMVPEHFGTKQAKVTLVDQVADAASGTFRVRLELENKDREVPAGLSCLATFDDLPRSDAVLSMSDAESGAEQEAASEEDAVLETGDKSAAVTGSDRFDDFYYGQVSGSEHDSAKKVEQYNSTREFQGM